MINKKALIKQLDGIEVQFGKIDHRTFNNFNEQMEQYLKAQQDLVKAYRALGRNKE